MKNGVMDKIKWFVVSILILLVAGMTVLGFAGFNNTLDYADSYEINITLEIVNDDAKEILKEITEGEASAKGTKTEKIKPAFDDCQLSLINPVNDVITDKLSSVDVNTLTPIEALNLIYELKNLL